MTVAARWAQDELAALARVGLRRQLEAIASPPGAVVRIDGAELINFSSNDYLGLASDPRIARVASGAFEKWGSGAGASRLLLGDSKAHRGLEADLAAFEHTEAALLFNSGYSANVGILSTLAGDADAIFSDALNHASIIDGCRLSRAKTVVYPHADVEALEAKLKATTARRRIIVTDSVFSMDGDMAPLADLASLAERYDAALVVDEAHATGVLGETGAGACEAVGVESRVDIRMGTLGKALGVFGAYVATSMSVAEWLTNKARSLVFSTALPPALCVAAAEAVRIVQTDFDRRARLWRNIRRFAEGLRVLGFEARGSSAIFPVVVGGPERALALSNALRARGILAKAIRPPTVPEGTSRLRFAVTAAHSEEHLSRALDALAALEVRRAS